jgi:hypothetical protein
MNLREWSKSEVDYGRKVLNSGLAGARTGRETFLHGNSLTSFLNKSVREALTPAAIGALAGVVSSCPGDRHRSASRAIAFGLTGWVIGFGVGMLWESRGLSASITNGAVRNISRVRDEHWLERHPIDYA